MFVLLCNQEIVRFRLTGLYGKFVFCSRRIAHLSEIALETPAFATFGNGEIDFYVKELISERTYAVEVKSGKNSGKTVVEALKKKKAVFVLYVKGNTYSGKIDNIITIPIYGISKFKF